MKRLVLMSLMMFLNFISTACAEDLLIQVTSVVEGRTTPDGKPIVVDSTEVIATPGSSFRTKIKTGDEWTVIQGRLSKPVNGRYHVEYKHMESGELAMNRGVLAPTLHVNAMLNAQDVEIEKPVSIGTTILSVPWTSARGRVHNTSTYNAMVRTELALKPAKDHYDDWSPVMIGNVPVNSSP